MPDLRFNLDDAIRLLREHHANLVELLAQREAHYESELRAVAAALEDGGPAFDFTTAAGFYVGELVTDLTYPAGAALEINIHGRRADLATLARPLERGRYQVLVQFTRIGRPGDVVNKPSR